MINSPPKVLEAWQLALAVPAINGGGEQDEAGSALERNICKCDAGGRLAAEEEVGAATCVCACVCVCTISSGGTGGRKGWCAHV